MSVKTLYLHPHNGETQKWGGPESENSNIKTLNPNPEFLKGFSVGGANNVEVLIGGPDF